MWFGELVFHRLCGCGLNSYCKENLPLRLMLQTHPEKDYKNPLFQSVEYD